jgi:hypothetical protein
MNTIQVPIFDRKTGQPAGTEPETEVHYFLNGKEIPDDMAPHEIMEEAGLESTQYLYDSATIFGEILGWANEGDAVELDLSDDSIRNAKKKVKEIFESLGISKEPKVYLALCSG